MLADLRAQAVALRDAGMRLLVAAPVLPAAHPAAKGCTSEEFSTDDLDFELLHLPVYVSMRDYLRRKERLVHALEQHLAVADIAQLGYGGHPMMLGEVAWPIAHKVGAKIVWMFDAIDPFERMKQQNRRDANPVRRLAKHRLVNHKLHFCKHAVARADLVIAHHPSIKDRFAEAWDSHCRLFPPPLFDGDMLPTEAQLQVLAARRADKTRPLRLATFAPHRATDPADHLVRALAHCRRLSVPVSLEVIASAAEAATYLQLAGQLAMHEHVHHTPAPPDPAGWMAVLSECDALFSIARDGFDPQKTFIAMAAGLPVVTYENPATDRLIETSKAGTIVPEQNVLLLAQAMIDLHRERRLLNSQGEHAWQAAQQRTLQANHRARAELIVSRLTRRAKANVG